MRKAKKIKQFMHSYPSKSPQSYPQVVSLPFVVASTWVAS